eukprot:TRINITY_DN64230_c0_g1_i1.p1 TRINITY_DN64230_c0_g1~~TRINITY_DN64230_c0_g1_i1.p1  ORF type:complete len:308 (-),score=91.18 TRINITY_DN64230_c0_g1_i1:204-1127(-)
MTILRAALVPFVILLVSSSLVVADDFDFDIEDEPPAEEPVKPPPKKEKKGPAKSDPKPQPTGFGADMPEPKKHRRADACSAAVYGKANMDDARAMVNEVMEKDALDQAKDDFLLRVLMAHLWFCYTGITDEEVEKVHSGEKIEMFFTDDDSIVSSSRNMLDIGKATEADWIFLSSAVTKHQAKESRKDREAQKEQQQGPREWKRNRKEPQEGQQQEPPRWKQNREEPQGASQQQQQQRQKKDERQDQQNDRYQQRDGVPGPLKNNGIMAFAPLLILIVGAAIAVWWLSSDPASPKKDKKDKKDKKNR